MPEIVYLTNQYSCNVDESKFLSLYQYVLHYKLFHRNTNCNMKIVCHTFNNIKHKGHGCSNGQLTFNSSSISHSFFSKAFFSFFSVSVRPPELATYISIKCDQIAELEQFTPISSILLYLISAKLP